MWQIACSTACLLVMLYCLVARPSYPFNGYGRMLRGMVIFWVMPFALAVGGSMMVARSSRGGGKIYAVAVMGLLLAVAGVMPIWLVFEWLTRCIR